MLRPQEALEKTEGSFIERLAHQLGNTANARHIYGEPTERDGVVVIPVAKAAYAFGGGGGKKDGEKGSGGGGAVKVTPVGYIEIKDGETRFRPIHDWLAFLPAIAATAPAVWLTIWGVTKLLRRRL